MEKMTKKEEEMMYNACSAYGNQLSEMAKKICEPELAKELKDRAEEYFKLSVKLIKK